jgi:hypothetical protein
MKLSHGLNPCQKNLCGSRCPLWHKNLIFIEYIALIGYDTHVSSGRTRIAEVPAKRMARQAHDKGQQTQLNFNHKLFCIRDYRMFNQILYTVLRPIRYTPHAVRYMLFAIRSTLHAALFMQNKPNLLDTENERNCFLCKGI